MSSYRELIDRIRDEADIVSVIGGYVDLKKSGVNYKALCPFHKEKTPSFYVSPPKGIFHCFGCNKGGDVIGFIKEIENVDFRQAAEMLAKKLGIPVPRFRPAQEEKEEEKRRTLLLEINKLAASFLQNNLKDTHKGRTAREYLAKRGIDDATAEKFGLGFALDGWSHFLKYASSKGYSINALEEAGLIVKSNDSQYDRFRNRVTFTIWDGVGNVVGFGGRVLDASNPKYINSPETLLYKKGQNLYALHLAKQSIREHQYALITEGYLDVIAAHQFGFENAIATLGTALTDSQARMLKRITPRVVFIYDPDEAGRKAMLSGCEVLLRSDFRIDVIVLPDNLDPDDFIRTRGKDAFEQEIRNAHDFFDFLIRVAADSYDLSTIEGKIQAIDLFKPLLHNVKNTIRLSDYMRRLGEAVNLPEDIIRNHLRDITAGTEGLREKIKDRGIGQIDHVEKGLLRLLLDSHNAIESVNLGDFSVEWISDDTIRRWISKIVELEHADSSTLLDSSEDENDSAFLRQVLLWDEEILDPEKTLQQLIQRLKIRYSQKKSRMITDKINAEYGKNPDTDLSPFLSSLQLEAQEKFKQAEQYRHLGHLPQI